MKKLKFHVPDKNGKTKCHKIHIGKNEEFCPKLKVHGTEMESVNEDTYLGDVLSGDGKNTKNINKRISKGIGIMSSIFNLLDQISLGSFYFEISVILRESMFLNGILTNIDVWHNVKKSEIDELEELDRSLLKKILKVPMTTPNESLYLELGILPIGIIIKARRILYLHYLVNSDKKEMLYKFFIIQWLNPIRGDWSELVKEDMTNFGINFKLEDLTQISKQSFKIMVKKKARECAFEELIKMKNGHSKMEMTKYSDIKMQDYTKSESINLKDALNLFKFRTRMAEFGENFRAGASQILCPLCQEDWDSQAHSFQCKEIKKEVEMKIELREVYSNKISNEAAKTITKIMDVRKKLLNREK